MKRIGILKRILSIVAMLLLVPAWANEERKPSPVLYNLASDRGETIDVAAKHPEMVTRMLELAGDARAKLGEYMHRGSEQRPTGSVIPNAPVISHPKDWHIVDSAIDNAITTERRKRHPGYADRKKKRKR